MFDDQILHDLKNPLAGITGSLGLFLEGLLGCLDDDQRKQLENIDFSAKKLTLLLKELSVVSNAEQGPLLLNKGTFPAGELRPGLDWIIRLAAKEQKAVELSFDDKLSLSADKELTGLVVQDLLHNATRQAERGGRAVLALSREKDGQLLFEISSDGSAGFPPEALPHVFEKDFRTKHQELKMMTSPGAGFYFCKLAVEAQGGRIGIESRPGATKVYFRLPAGR